MGHLLVSAPEHLHLLSPPQMQNGRDESKKKSLGKDRSPDHRAPRSATRLHNCHAHWFSGLWVGKSILNDENLMMTQRVDSCCAAQRSKRLETGKEKDQTELLASVDFPGPT